MVGVKQTAPDWLIPSYFISCLLSVILSEWSEWTACSLCLPFASLQRDTSLEGDVNGSKMVSIQRRFRACLDPDSGLPVSRWEEESQCPGPLVEERLCPDANICRGNGVCPITVSWVSPLYQARNAVSSSLSLCQAPAAPLTPVTESDEWGDFAPAEFFLPWGSSLRLGSHHKFVCRQHSELVTARLRMTVVMKWLRCGGEGDT